MTCTLICIASALPRHNMFCFREYESLFTVLPETVHVIVVCS